MSKLNKIKTIDVDAREWFDKVNGNSYFSGTVTINYGMKGQREYKMPFQYGYGDHYQDVAFNVITEHESVTNPDNWRLWRYCRENNIILRANKIENCKKRELMQ